MLSNFRCHHCHQPGSIELDDYVIIERKGGHNFTFHTTCFEEVAGYEYTPGQKSYDQAIEEIIDKANQIYREVSSKNCAIP